MWDQSPIVQGLLPASVLGMQQAPASACKQPCRLILPKDGNRSQQFIPAMQLGEAPHTTLSALYSLPLCLRRTKDWAGWFHMWGSGFDNVNGKWGLWQGFNSAASVKCDSALKSYASLFLSSGGFGWFSLLTIRLFCSWPQESLGSSAVFSGVIFK